MVSHLVGYVTDYDKTNDKSTAPMDIAKGKKLKVPNAETAFISHF